MNWRFCVYTREQHALDLCSGSMNEGSGYGYGYGAGYGDGWGGGSGNSSQEWR